MRKQPPRKPQKTLTEAQRKARALALKRQAEERGAEREREHKKGNA